MADDWYAGPMKTTFFFESTVTIDGCDNCGTTVPIDPFTVFPYGVRHMASQCPGCQQVEKFYSEDVLYIITAGAGIGRLKELAEDPESDQSFDTLLSLKRKIYKPKARGTLESQERCVHCRDPIVVPSDIATDAVTSASCKSCGEVTYMVPAPRWIRDGCPQMTHVMMAEPPTECRCPRCGGVILVGARAPLEVRCEHCEEWVEIEAPASTVTEPRPFFARLRLSSQAVRASASSFGIFFALFFLGLAAALFALGVSGAREGGDSAKGGAVMLSMGSLLAMVGLIVLPFAIRGRMRRRAFADRIEALERQEAELAAQRGKEPFR